MRLLQTAGVHNHEHLYMMLINVKQAKETQTNTQKQVRNDPGSVAVRQLYQPRSQHIFLLLYPFSLNFILFQVSFLFLLNLSYFILLISYPVWPGRPVILPLLMGLPLWTPANQVVHSAVKPLPPFEIKIEKGYVGMTCTRTLLQQNKLYVSIITHLTPNVLCKSNVACFLEIFRTKCSKHY